MGSRKTALDSVLMKLYSGLVARLEKSSERYLSLQGMTNIYMVRAVIFEEHAHWMVIEEALVTVACVE